MGFYPKERSFLLPDPFEVSQRKVTRQTEAQEAHTDTGHRQVGMLQAGHKVMGVMGIC